MIIMPFITHVKVERISASRNFIFLGIVGATLSTSIAGELFVPKFDVNLLQRCLAIMFLQIAL